MPVRRLVQNRPVVISAALPLIVLLHALATWRFGGNIWSSLLTATNAVGDVQIPVYLGLAGVAAFVGGFAGVVVVFALESSSPQFRKFRQKAGGALQRSATSIVASPFGAALLGLMAALLAPGPFEELGPWVLEWGLLALAHATIRMLWLFSVLFGIVRVTDAVEGTKEKQSVMMLEIFGEED